jgi:hypothetical protein
MVFAMPKHNMNAGIPTIFRSYHASTNQIPDCTIWEALSATTAHPGHFKSIDIGEPPMRESFVAGAMGCTNPIVHVLDEVKRVCPDRYVACIVCIGAGHARTIRISEPSPMQRILAPKDTNCVAMSIATDSERVAHEMAVRFGGTTDVYFRLSVEQGMQNIELDDWDQLSKVVTHTRAYMRQVEVNANINKIVQAIRNRDETIPTAQIGTFGLVTSQYPHLILNIVAADGQIQLPSTRQVAGVKYCPEPTPVFTGQSTKIERVEKCIAGGDKERCVFVLHGLGGAGKTQIALKTIQKTRDIWTDIVYVDATSRETTTSTLQGFARLKNIGKTHEDTLRWLGSHRERWLMMFDNADDPLLGITDFFPQGNHGSIIITTRIPGLALLAQGVSSDCAVLSMCPDEALELLMKTARLHDKPTSEAEHSAAVSLIQV